MQWSFPIAKVAGSEIRIHVTFFLLLAWIGIVQFQQGGQSAAIEGIAFIVTIFACVVLHELGHAVAARRYGIRTPRITLLPIGGVAELERMPEKPAQEIVVAVAGPLVNVAIARVLVFGFGAVLSADAMNAIENPAQSFLSRVAAVNVVLVLFNLIPAFPMDGGRVLRALLATRLSRTKATDVAARIGQGLAFVFGFLGLLSGNVLLVFVAIFVYLAASGEAMAVNLQDAARVLDVRDAMITEFEKLGPNATLDDAVELLLATTQHEFPVVDGAGRLRGMLTREAMVAGLQASGRQTPVVDVMTRDIPVVRVDAGLEAALKPMQGSGGLVGVTDTDGRLVGYINRENIGELMMVRSAIGQ
ncbi:MAG: site-2 protease family protein [Pseudomonadota bacterium]|nr:site-2 protease family protein [Pseudomonadota bacterium]